MKFGSISDLDSALHRGVLDIRVEALAFGSPRILLSFASLGPNTSGEDIERKASTTPVHGTHSTPRDRQEVVQAIISLQSLS